MFREMRKKKRQVDPEQAMEVLQKGEYGVLSTIGDNGYPYGVPLNYVLMNDHIYFHCAQKGQKLENILHHEKVSFCVVEKAKILAKEFSTDFSSTIVFGKAVEVMDKEKKEALLAFIHKFSPQYIQEGIDYVEKMEEATKIIKIKIEHMTGKAR